MPPEGDEGFSQEYVKSLREENKTWRIKVRELEDRQVKMEADMSGKQLQFDVATELGNRGIKADPSWVKVVQGQSVSDAIDSFTAQYPNMVPGEEPPVDPVDPPVQPAGQPGKPEIPATRKPVKNTNSSGGSQSITDQRDDPTTRSKYRDQYRSLLAGGEQ